MENFISLAPHKLRASTITINLDHLVFFRRNKKDNETIIYLAANGLGANFVMVDEDVDAVYKMGRFIKLITDKTQAAIFVNSDHIIDFRPHAEIATSSVVRLTPYDPNDANIHVVDASIIDIFQAIESVQNAA